MTEFRLFDDPGADVAQIVTDGATIKPFLSVVERVDSEARLHVTENGLSVTLVDPANVFMVEAELGADAFNTYELTEVAELGVNVGSLKSLVRRARKGHDDELTLSLQEREITATVARGYDNHNVVSEGTMDTYDPDSIRQEPDIPDLERDVAIDVDRGPLTDALSYAMGVCDYIKMSTKGVNQHTEALHIGGETDTRDETAAIDGISAPTGVESLYSSDYMKQILGGINDVDAETVEVIFGTEFPATFKMERDDVPFSVEYLMAPRIHSE